MSKKTGKNIKCKTCKKEFYIPKCKINFRKYCSKKCASKDNYGWRPKKKVCKICGGIFIIKTQLNTTEQTCSIDCKKENHKRIRKKSDEKRKHTILKRVCVFCKKDFETNAYIKAICCSRECHYKKLSIDRKGKGNPGYRHGKDMGRGDSKHRRACAKYKKKFIEKYGFQFCEVCKVNKNGTFQFEVHHIYYASRFPKHKNLHDPRNLIHLCIQCHNNFHSGKYKDEFANLEKERGLKKLFSYHV